MGWDNRVGKLIEQAKEEYPTISLLLTMRCNYTCRHCFYECGPDLPGDPAGVNQPRRQPHAFMVMQPARLGQPAAESVYTGHSG